MFTMWGYWVGNDGLGGNMQNRFMWILTFWRGLLNKMEEFIKFYNRPSTFQPKS